MIIKNNSDVVAINIQEQDIKYVEQKVLIGPEDGSTNIIMRSFKISFGGNTPFHSHAHEHVVKVMKGKGIIKNANGEEILLESGQNLFIKGEEKHQFKNPYQEPFEFLCIILNPL